MRIISDFAWAVATVWAEARGEPYAGKVAVANVIRNRARLRACTIAEVVLAPLQFSCWNARDPNRLLAALVDDNDPVVHDCAQAWLASEFQFLVDDATLYANLDALDEPPSWVAAVREVVKIGRHTFYSESKPSETKEA